MRQDLEREYAECVRNLDQDAVALIESGKPLTSTAGPKMHTARRLYERLERTHASVE